MIFTLYSHAKEKLREEKKNASNLNINVTWQPRTVCSKHPLSSAFQYAKFHFMALGTTWRCLSLTTTSWLIKTCTIFFGFHGVSRLNLKCGLNQQWTTWGPGHTWSRPPISSLWPAAILPSLTQKWPILCCWCRKIMIILDLIILGMSFFDHPKYPVV